MSSAPDRGEMTIDPRYHTQRWQKLRAMVIRRDGGRCVINGCQVDTTERHRLHVDHIIEVRDGGAFWDETNLQTLCQPHHRAKTLDARARRPSEPVSPNA